MLPQGRCFADRRVENSVAYQRELLFGAPTDKYRAEGQALVARLETMIADRLATTAGQRGIDTPHLNKQALLAGRGVFAVLHMILARPSAGAHPGHDAIDDLRDQITHIVTGFFASVDPDNTDTTGRTSPRAERKGR